MRTVIPAQPGWFVVDPIREDDMSIKEILLDPVIAWVVVSDIEEAADTNERWLYKDKANHEVLALTVEGLHDDRDGDQILKRPDEKFVAPYDREFQHEREVIAYLNEREERRTALRLSRQKKAQ